MSTHVPGFQSFSGFLSYFVMAKLATSSMRVNGIQPKSQQDVSGVGSTYFYMIFMLLIRRHVFHGMQLMDANNSIFQEDERRIASVMARKEEEKRRESNKIAVMKVISCHKFP